LRNRVVGIPVLFLAVIHPHEAVRIHLGHHAAPLAMLLTRPASVGRLVLDLGAGAALLLVFCPLLVARRADRPARSRADEVHEISAPCRGLGFSAPRPRRLREPPAGFHG
jgi:hypothetical protein